ELAGLADHVHLESESHARFFESLSKAAIDEPDGGKILHARESGGEHFGEKVRHAAKGVGAAHSREHGSMTDNPQDLARHFHRDRVGIAIGHHARQGATAGHAEAAGVVDHNQVDAAGLGHFSA